MALAELRADLGLPERGPRPAAPIVFAREEDNRGFAVRFAERLGATMEAPRSDGFHLQGLALSSWKESAGARRPVFTHEFAHSVLSQAGRTDPQRKCWFQEGVANRCQLRLHPQASLAGIVAEWLADPARRSPLGELCGGGDIPMDRYGQAAVPVDAMPSDADLRPRMPALVEAFRRARIWAR